MSRKLCSHCKVEKPTGEFGKQKLSQDGLHTWCRACRSETGKAYMARIRGSVRMCTMCGGRFQVTNSVSYCRTCHLDRCRESARRWRLANPEKARLRKKSSHLRADFNLTLDQYDALLAAQNGGCAICGVSRSAAGKKLSVDHCHTTGAVRGLLCSRCNYGIGQFDDRPDMLRRAAEYLSN